MTGLDDGADPNEPSGKPAPDNEPDPAADAAGAGSQQGHEQQEADADTENPELKKLHDEAARHRVRAKEAEAEVAALTEEVRTLQLRLAFNDAAAATDITDTEAAWKLAADDLRAVKVTDNGTIDATRIGQILAHVADRYPYLVSAPAPAEPVGFPATLPSGRQTNGKRKDLEKFSADAVDQALIDKFPALTRRMRHRR